MAFDDDIIALKDRRKWRRRLYLAKSGQRLDRFLLAFLEKHMPVDFRTAVGHQMSLSPRRDPASWDYSGWRDEVMLAFSDALKPELERQLKSQRWHDPVAMPISEIVERCLSLYVLGIKEVSESGAPYQNPTRTAGRKTTRALRSR